MSECILQKSCFYKAQMQLDNEKLKRVVYKDMLFEQLHTFSQVPSSAGQIQK